MKDFFTTLPDWRTLLSNDFNRGYVLGVGVVLAVVLLILMVKILMAIAFRTRRCREIVVSAPDGDVMVAYEAVKGAITTAVTRFPAFGVRDIKLYRRGKRTYLVELFGSFDASGSAVFPQQAMEIKQTIFGALESIFGIDNVRQIRIHLESLSGARVEKVQLEEKGVDTTPVGLEPGTFH